MEEIIREKGKKEVEEGKMKRRGEGRRKIRNDIEGKRSSKRTG